MSSSSSGHSSALGKLKLSGRFYISTAYCSIQVGICGPRLQLEITAQMDVASYVTIIVSRFTKWYCGLESLEDRLPQYWALLSALNYDGMELCSQKE